jgi:acyl dehydratase
MTQTDRTTLALGQRFEHRVRAYNGATHSENKIHEDSVAKQFGFRGGLVPGVTDYAYMTRPAIDAFGVEWLERGTMSARFLKPIYHGEMTHVVGSVGAGGRLELAALNEEGELCAPGVATLPAVAAAAPEVADFPERPLPDHDARPAADEESLAAGTVLGTAYAEFVPEVAERYLAEAEDDHPAYRGPDAVAHPGYLIRFANEVLHRSVLMGPWIHVESETQHLSIVRYGEALSTRGKVLELFERKGHRFVVLDVLTVANGDRPVQRVRHTAIYQLRPPE